MIVVLQDHQMQKIAFESDRDRNDEIYVMLPEQNT